MVRVLSISKASVSTGIRQLISWGAIKQVWGQGGRRDYYEANHNIAALIRRSYFDYIKPKLTAFGRSWSCSLQSLVKKGRWVLLHGKFPHGVKIESTNY